MKHETMCDHCGRTAVDADAGALCHAPIDRAQWQTVQPRAQLVAMRDNGQEICLGRMHPIEDYAG